MEIVRGRRRIAAGLGLAGLLTAVALAGCGADAERSDSAGGSTARDAVDAPEAAEAEAPGAAAVPGEAPPDAAPERLRADGRSIVYTGSITVRVDNPDEVAAKAIAVVAGSGGFVGSDKRSSDEGDSRAWLELRVPADRFNSVVEQLARLGKEEGREINTEDVTEQVVDLDARIASQQASVNRTRALLAQARTIAEIVSVEGELAKREADLGSLQAKQRRLADLTSLSTVTLVLLGPDVEAADAEPATGFLAGLKGGWRAFGTSLEVLLTVLGAMLPWLIALGLSIYAVVWLTRRLARRSRPAAVRATEARPGQSQPGDGRPTTPAVPGPDARPAP